jgi:hypothetical protein
LILNNYLQQRLGTPEKRWQSLNTDDPVRARQAGRPIIERWEREFEALRRPPQRLTEAELQDAVWKRHVELIAADEKMRLSLPTEEDIKQIWAHLEGRFLGSRGHAESAFR